MRLTADWQLSKRVTQSISLSNITPPRFSGKASPEAAETCQINLACFQIGVTEVAAIWKQRMRFGGADRDRTGDPLLAKQVLSQLSYSPILVVGCQFSVVSRFSDN